MGDMMDKIYGYLAQYGLSVIAAIIIFVFGKWLAHKLAGFVEKIMLKANVDKTLASFSKNLTYVALLVFVIIAALGKLGVQTTSFIAVIGASGLAVGLALQGALSNFAAGVLIILFRPFKVGDFIQAGGVTGTVAEIQTFTTILYALDNRKEIVPNAQITSATITNFSDVDKRRVDLVFGISYTDNIKTAKDVLMEIAKADPRVLKDPAPVIAVSELGDSSVSLVCRPWVKPSDYWVVYFDMLEKGKLELEKKGITIPFPQRDVHIYEEKKQ
ncbi:MAG: mechanosensitive ion channel domain-containing protein [Candidatus Omnitrophota bacterium]